MHLLDKHITLVRDFVYQVLKIAGIDLCPSETPKRTFGYALRHFCLTDDEYVIFQDIVPNLILNINRNICSQHVVVSVVLEFLRKDTICHIERIESRLGVDFQYSGIPILKNRVRNFPVINKARCDRLCFHSLIEEDISTYAVPDMHIHDSPWSKHRFLVRIAEVRKYPGHSLHSFHRCELVCLSHKVPIVMSDSTEHIRVVIRNKFFEKFLGNTSRHELFPGLIVYQFCKVVECYILTFIFEFNAIHKKRKADGYATKY